MSEESERLINDFKQNKRIKDTEKYGLRRKNASTGRALQIHEDLNSGDPDLVERARSEIKEYQLQWTTNKLGNDGQAGEVITTLQGLGHDIQLVPSNEGESKGKSNIFKKLKKMLGK